MSKYKICPSCKTKNDPTLLECLNCEADLTRVKITDEETEKMLQENAAAPAAPEKTKMVRVCDCGAKNPPNARKCGSCGEDISDITPTSDSAADTEPAPDRPTYIFSSLDGQYAHRLTVEDAVVGREHLMSEYLASKSYVSRSHARLTVENGNLYIENLSRTNYTFVNNKKIQVRTRLEDGDELGLGGTNINGECQAEAAYFLVRIEPCM